jgi:hypothetical protein
MVDRIGGKGKGPYRANGGSPDVVTLVEGETKLTGPN